MTQHGSGTTTFVFTDLEGSTRLLRRVKDAYAELLDTHQRLARTAFEANRGEEVDTQGDSFFVAFPRARDAVAAAVELQRGIAHESWPAGAEVMLRIGLASAGRGRASGRCSPARPRAAAAEGLRTAEASLPARDRGAPERLPAAARHGAAVPPPYVRAAHSHSAPTLEPLSQRVDGAEASGCRLRKNASRADIQPSRALAPGRDHVHPGTFRPGASSNRQVRTRYPKSDVRRP